MKEKKECPKCHRKLRTRCFVINKVTGESICKTCDKRVGSNKWYITIPNKFRRNKVGKYSLGNEEIDLIKQTKGFRVLKRLTNHLDRRKKFSQAEKLNNPKKEDLNKKLIEGLNG